LDCFSTEVTLRIWDIFLYEGYDILYTLAITVIRQNKDYLLKNDLEGIMTFFTKIKEYEVDPEEFVKEIKANRIKSSTIQQFTAEYVNATKK